VAERISLFYEAFPRGRIITELMSRTERDVVFRAVVYRQVGEEPAATGWAAEREGDGDINTVACLENTETSAIGRALANLGFTASRERPSAEEMAKASRARVQLGLVRLPNEARPSALVYDLSALITRAETFGLRAARAERWRRLVSRGDVPEETLLRCERRLRLWVLARTARA
jgi:hypothetical protein